VVTLDAPSTTANDTHAEVAGEQPDVLFWKLHKVRTRLARVARARVRERKRHDGSLSAGSASR
jgi:hypothetical protein